MATIRRKKAEPFSILQRDPGPWPTLLINWMATLGIIVIFGLVMLFSASYTTGYLRFGDSLHFIRSQGHRPRGSPRRIPQPVCPPSHGLPG